MALREFDFEKEPTVSVVKKILTDAINMKATDIHFDPTPDELIIKFRINGELKEYSTAPDNVKINIITRLKIISGMNITNSLLPQTGAISFDLDNKSHNMRVSSLPIVDGEKIVVHLSSYAKNIKNINKLGFSEETNQKIKKMLNEKQGIILITGTTNSGKTTTTYSLLKELNNKTNNIISIEDPIKMKIKGINQVAIAKEKGLTYRTLLKAIMLQDPNIIAINELIDDETARSALRASLTGHLVISTMYTKNIDETINNLLNMDIEKYLLSSNLLGIISQRMVKKLCPTCREKKKASPYEKKIIKKILNEDIEELYYPNGCEECQNGYIDKFPIEESIIIDSELRNAIANNKKRSLIHNIIYGETDSIIKNGLKKVIEGETSFAEIIRILDLKVDFTEDEQDIQNLILGKEPINEDDKEEKQTKKSKKEEAETKEGTNKETIKEEEKTKEEPNKVDEELLNLAHITALKMVEKQEEEQPTPPKIEEVKEVKNEIQTMETKPQIEEKQAEPKKQSKVIPLNNDSDDDDDDFSYGDSYKINF